MIINTPKKGNNGIIYMLSLKKLIHFQNTACFFFFFKYPIIFFLWGKKRRKLHNTNGGIEKLKYNWR